MKKDERIQEGGPGSGTPVEEDAMRGIWEEQFWDDMSGQELNCKLVKEARAEEMAEFRRHKVYIKVPIQ